MSDPAMLDEGMFRWRRAVPDPWRVHRSGSLSSLVADLGGWANCTADLDTRKSREAVERAAIELTVGERGRQIQGARGACFDVERVA